MKFSKNSTKIAFNAIKQRFVNFKENHKMIKKINFVILNFLKKRSNFDKNA